jgi:CRISPR-associated protein Csb1
VRKLTRSAQYVPAAEYIAQGLLEDTDDKKTRDAYAERGFIHVPASGSHGGVIATGGIRRDATLSLSALRMVSAGQDVKKTLSLRRYILGIALTAFTCPVSGYLRQGCNLVVNPDKPREFVEVYSDGNRVPSKLTHEDALAFAQAAAKEFGIGKSRSVPFETERALTDIKGDSADGDKAGKKGKNKK